MSKRRFHTGWRLEVHGNHHQADDNQRHDSDDFDHREPELHLTEHFHGGKVKAQQQDHYRQRGDPVGKTGEPELRVGGNSDDIRHPGHHPTEPVGPAGEITRPRSQQIRSKVAKRFVFQIREQQFSHCAHHEKEHKANDHINKNDRRPGETDRFTRPHKQPRTNGTADGDKLNMSVCKIAP